MFERVVIVGVGLLGCSLGLALKGRGMARRVVGVGRSGSRSLAVALERGAIDESYIELGQALSGGADLVVLCTPVRQFPAAFEAMKGKLGAGTVVTDVGSTKGQVMAWARDILGEEGGKFVGSHPMAGSEKRGPEAAREDLYEGGVCLICGGSNDEKGGVLGVENAKKGGVLGVAQGLWRGVGMRVLELEAGEHDRWVATISHLPHAAAFSLMNAAAAHPEMLAAVAGGFLDTTRVASSDVDMWTDIFLTNRAAVVGAIEEYARDLEKLKGAIAAGDEGAIRAAISGAKRARDELVARRKAGGASE